MSKPVSFTGILKFILIIVLTVAFTYFTSRVLSIIWYLILLVWYYNSDDEPLWFAVFLTTTDGFMGFMGLYSVTIPLLPGMPAIELIHFYIFLSAVKAARRRLTPYCFFNKYLHLVLIYLFFMFIWGQMMGFSEGMNGYFRLLKLTLPLLLFYSIPRLFTSVESFEKMFSYVFIILLSGFVAQIFNLVTGTPPAGVIGIVDEQAVEMEDFRVFYSLAATLIAFMGALFFIAARRTRPFSMIYLYVLIFSAFSMAILSATRGWIISFGIVIILMLIIVRIRLVRSIGFILLISLMSYLGWSNLTIREQVIFSQERLISLEPLLEGDLTAGGTVKRLDVRGPRVMGAWKENKLFGWGFSDVSRKYNDSHVANQNILMSSGIVGLVILYGFFLVFTRKMIERYLGVNKDHYLRNSLLILVIFFWGWFIIHSTSGQQFNYGGIPLLIAPQAVFFSFSSLIYNETLRN